MKKTILLLFIIIFSTQAYAQDFTKQIIDDTFGFTRGIEIADLNNDGNIDVVGLKAFETFEVACWFGDGTGNFSDKVLIDNSLVGTLSTGSGMDIAVLDINNDDYLDIIISSEVPFEGHKILAYLNNKDNTFSNYLIIDSGGFASRDIEIFDVDGNGFKDIVSAYENRIDLDDQSIYYFPNLGNGTFGQRQTILKGNNKIWGLRSVFLNNDLNKDLVYTKNSSLNVILNNGDGTFSDSNIIDDEIISFYRVYTGKIDNDDFEDIIATGLGFEETLVWYAGDGLGSFSSRNIISNMEYVLISHSQVADIDNDGNNDIVATAETDLIWWKNDGNGNFGSPNIIFSESDANNYDVKVVDMNKNNKLDIIMSNAEGIFWFQNDLTLSNENNQSNYQDLVIYPNPSSEKFNIETSQIIDKIFVYNVLGNLISEIEMPQKEIDLTNKKSGIYILKVMSGKNASITKIIKE